MTTPQSSTPISTPPSGQLPSSKPQPKSGLIFGILAAIVIAVLIWVGVIIYNSYQAAQQQANAEEGPTVLITGDGFKPAALTIKAGQDITWTNQDERKHVITADQDSLPGLNSTELADGDSYTYIFEAQGTYHYYDPSDPQVFQGTVIVE